jgi:probable DNA repair protein
LPHTATQHVIDHGVLENLLADGYALLTPNLRLARGLTEQWTHIQQSKGLTVWQSALISPLESWLLKQWHNAVDEGFLAPLLPASPAQLQELWQEVIEQHQTATQGYTLIRPTGAAALASRARDNLLRWSVDINQPACRQQFLFDEDCSAFFAWQALLTQKLAALEMTTNSDCLQALLGCAHKLPKQKIALFGFDDIPPLLSALVDALAESTVTLAVLGEAGECKVREYADKRAELAAVAQWAKTISDRPDNATVGIILPEMQSDRSSLEYLLRREFDCLGSNYTSLPVNFSAGISMDRVPLVRDAVRILGMSRSRVDLTDIVALLRSRFVTLSDTNTSASIKFIRRLFDRGEQVIDAGEVRYLASRSSAVPNDKDLSEQGQEGLHIGRIMLELFSQRNLRGKALPSQWVDRFSDTLNAWGWPGEGPLDSIEYQQLKGWYEFLDQFAAFDQVCAPMTFEEALQLLCRAIAGATSQPQTPESNLQVLGILEAAGQNFDHLWIVGMQAGRWPAAAKPNPFIPVHMQRELNMPQASAEREWSFASNLMAQYLRSAVEIIASYSVQNEGVPEKGSSLLDEFPRVTVTPPDIVNPQWVALQEAAQPEYFVDNCAPALEREELAAIRGGSGLLEDQSQCPFRAFAKRRLGIQPLSEHEIALSAAERGTLLHDVLYALWGGIGDSDTLGEMSAVTLESLIATSIAQGLQKVAVSRRNALGVTYFELETKRLSTLLAQWVEVEKKRSPFVVLAREQEIELQLSALSISMRADRIDVMPDGAQFVIDYKSGLCSLGDWLGDRPAKPQLPLYALAMEQTVAGLSYAQIRPDECKYIGAGQIEVAEGVRADTEKWVKDKMPVKDWEDLTEQWRDNLERLAQEFLRGESSVNPLNNSCTFCGLQPLCRIDDQPAASS